jgi:predicted RNA binding protein YcfA (HicA-like mRNA interferase family)
MTKKEFSKLLESQGWTKRDSRGKHIVYEKDTKHISISNSSREIQKHMLKRLMKENGIELSREFKETL